MYRHGCCSGKAVPSISFVIKSLYSSWVKHRTTTSSRPAMAIVPIINSIAATRRRSLWCYSRYCSAARCKFNRIASTSFCTVFTGDKPATEWTNIWFSRFIFVPKKKGKGRERERARKRSRGAFLINKTKKKRNWIVCIYSSFTNLHREEKGATLARKIGFKTEFFRFNSKLSFPRLGCCLKNTPRERTKYKYLAKINTCS